MKSRLLYVLLLGSAIWTFMLYEDYSAFLFLFVFVMMTLISVILSLVFSKFVRITLLSENVSVQKGEKVSLKIVAKNMSPFPFLKAKIRLKFTGNFMYGEKKIEVNCGINDFRKNEITLDFTSDYCGRVTVSIDKCYVYDLFYLFRYKVKSKGETCVYFMPSIEPYGISVKEAEYESCEDTDKYMEDRPGNDPSHVFELREYREGDKLQKIHWKLSAKKDETYVKEFGYPISISAVLYFDMHFTGEDREKLCDELIQKVCNLSASLIQNQGYHYISYYNEDEADVVRRQILDEENLESTIYELLNLSTHENVYDKSVYNDRYSGESINVIYVNDMEEILGEL